MKKIFLYLTISLFCLEIKSQDVSIPDPNFLKALIAEGVDKNKDNKIQISEAKATTKLDVSMRDIIDLTGIQGFINLDTLICSNNSWQFKGLDVTNNTSLTFLECIGLNLITLDVSKNIALIHLECNTNNLTSLDVSKNTALAFLYCDLNHLTTLNVSKNPNLTYLYCTDNKLTTLDVSQSPALTVLDCRYNIITKLDLTNNSALTHLSCTSNNLTTLLTGNAILTFLFCEGNKLAFLDISKNTELKHLNFGGNAPNAQICINQNQTADTTSWNLNKDPRAHWTTSCALGIQEETLNANKTLKRIYTLLGREIKQEQAIGGVFIYQYSDGSVKKIMKAE